MFCLYVPERKFPLTKMRYSKNHQIHKYVCALIKQQGWQFRISHYYEKPVTSNGKSLIIPRTPGDYRAFYNFRHDARRLEALG
jgi:hypothetical protein